MPGRTIASRIGPEAGQIILLAAAYFLAAKLSLLLAIPPGYATAVWPPSGIALAAMLLLGPRVWPGIWLGAALANWTVGGSPLLAILIATGNTMEAAAAATWIQRSLKRPGYFDSVENVVRFVALSALAAFIAATVGVASLGLMGAMPWSDFALNAWTWWQGDTSGMLIVAPLIISWVLGERPRWPLSKAIEAAAVAIALALATMFIFRGATPAGEGLPLAFFAFPFMIWVALRFGRREVTTASTIVCAIAIWHTLHGQGVFALGATNTSLLFLLAYTSTLVITGLVLSAVIGERERAMKALRASHDRLELSVEERTLELEVANQSLRAELAEHERQSEVLRQSEERFRLIVDGVKDYAIIMLDRAGKVAAWNAAAETIYGYTAREAIGSHFSKFYTAEDMTRQWHELMVARSEGRIEDEGWRVRKDGSRFAANVIITALRGWDGALQGFAKVSRDLTTRRRLEALQESERQMNEFLAMLSHELRNPLAPMVNALGLMKRRPGSDQTELRGVVERQVGHLARIVDDLLDVSRITGGKIALKKEILDLNAVVSHALESCRPLLEARRHAVELRLSDEPLPLDADATRLSQVLLNLINNAVKYTPEGGRISLETRRENEVALLRVRDNGIGISAALLPRVFDLFVQGDRSLDRTEGGLGIGLTLVRRLVEMHGGSVAAFSEGAGDGSEFVVRLPLALGRAATPRMLPAEPEARPRTRRRLLVVDDNRDFANTLSLLLETFGHEVRTVYDGRAVLPMATDYRPDAVLLDIGLPGMNGYEIARELRSAPALSQLTLVAFTGYGQEEDRRRVREAGFDFHLVKPVEVAELTRVIDGLP
ncbi:MAG: PAS domain S-box protein [Betaproteobacteria bacterium]|nr:MAG: PAS domain S-box protein [Betaproteobacteria bacterium]